MLTIIFLCASIDIVKEDKTMKKHYRLKQKWGVVLFYTVVIILTLLYSLSMR